MKKIAFVFVLMSCLVMNAQAEVAKYCMSFNDLIENNWKSVDELTQGRANQVCQIKTSEKQVRFKTGVKDVDKMLKKEAFAVMVGNQLYVNCRNMRNNSQPLDVNGFTPAVRYDNDKICIMAYKSDKAMFALSLGMAFAGDFIDNRAVRFGMWTGSTAAWITSDMLSGKVCYLVDGNTDRQGNAVCHTHERQVHGELARQRRSAAAEIQGHRQQAQPTVGRQRAPHTHGEGAGEHVSHRQTGKTIKRKRAESAKGLSSFLFHLHAGILFVSLTYFVTLASRNLLFARK